MSMTGFTPELVRDLRNAKSALADDAADCIAELTEALRELRAEVQRLLLTTQADTKRADCPVMAVAKASAKAGNVLAQHGRSK